DLGFRRDGLDHGHSLVTRSGVLTIDAYVAVVIDVDGSTGLFGDAADGHAALADHVTDLVGVDLQHGHARGVLGDRRTRRGDHLVHLTEDVDTRLVGLLQGVFHDLFGDALDLDVHLQRGNALGGTGHLEVHVAEVVFVTEDVGEYGV